MSEALNALQEEIQGVTKLMRENADEMRKQDGRLQGVESMLQEKDDRLQARLDELKDEMTELWRGTRSANGETGEDKVDPYSGTFAKYLRKGEQRLSRDEFEILDSGPKETRDLTVNDDGDGGYWVSPVMSNRVATRIFDTSPLRPFATVESITTDALEGLADNDEAAAGWVAEEGARTDTDTPTIDKWTIPVHELYAQPRATQKLLDDAGIDVEAWLARKVSQRFTRLENTAFVLGNGVGQPRGFMTYADGTAWGQIEQIPSGGASALTADGLIDLEYALQAEYRRNAAFAMRRATVAIIRKLVDGNTQYLWQPGLRLGEPDSLLGHPIVEMEDIAAVGAGNLAIAFADWSEAYTIVDRIGVRVLRDPFTSKPYVRFYTTRRVGGDVVNFDAIKIQDVAAS